MENYAEVVKWIKLKWSIDLIIQSLDNINFNIYNLQKTVSKAIIKDEKNVALNEKNEADNTLNSYFW